MRVPTKIALTLATSLTALALLAPTASAALDINAFDGSVAANPAGDPFTQAGGHPYSATTAFELSSTTDSVGHIVPEGKGSKDILVRLPAGFAGDPGAASTCSMPDFLTPLDALTLTRCLPAAQVGRAGPWLVVDTQVGGGLAQLPIPLYNLVPAHGQAALFGFMVPPSIPVFLEATVESDESGEYRIVVASRETTQTFSTLGAEIELWGVPADPSHDPLRTGKNCPNFVGCSLDVPRRPFVTLPTSCSPEGEGLIIDIAVDSWQEPGVFATSSFETHDPPGFSFQNPLPPSEWGPPKGTTDCDLVPFNPTIDSAPTTDQAETPSGLDVEVEVPDLGLLNPDGIAQSHIRNSIVTLPEGITINPSQAEGLGVCTPAQYESAALGEQGCPSQSKVGTVSVRTPLLEEAIPGSVYVAQPFANPFGSLLAIYIVLEEPQRGIHVKLAGELRTNERTGQIEAEFSDLPQFPFSSFHFHFREGARAPLVTPPACGTYETKALFVPWSDPNKELTTTSQFQITRGVGGGPCPKGGIPPFKPDFSAGSLNNHAGAHTPFTMRLTRKDGEQNMTRFSAVLPPGVLGKLAGVSRCPDSAIPLAKAKSGHQEIAAPSCPPGSEIGRSLVGAGVGSVLTYVPGKVYLGGPFHGDPLSVIAITPVVAGPFDVGTVVVREALTLNPKTAEVQVDGEASDPIPHILEGIPAKLRDLRVYIDRDRFILNPTSCDPDSTDATLFGSFLNVLDPADDVPVSLFDRFQAANCAALGFKPGLNLQLKGGTRRGGHPGLKALYRPRPGDANLEGLVVRLPRSAFLDQAHIRTICTRVQFAADNCPSAAQYGYIKAFTPLLEEPLEGPVWLRSSSHKLPDLIFDLHGLVDVEVATRIDSAKGGIRATVESAPDAPLSKVELRMQGGKKGLIVNSRNLCDAISRANVEFAGHNGKEAKANPVMRADGCGGKRKR